MRARFYFRLLAIAASILGALLPAGFLWHSVHSAALPTPTDTSNSAATHAASILINEVDAVTQGSGIDSFVELFTGGHGHTALDGLVLVLFNGQDDRSYAAIDLTGFQSSSDGYFLVGNQAVPGVDLIITDTIVQGGPDAVALFQGSTADFPNGTAVTRTNLIDALVYGTGDDDDPGLLLLLEAGEAQVNEDSHTLATFHSNQRCPNGAGEPRRTQNYLQAPPTPKAANNCPGDSAPQLAGSNPFSASQGVAIDSHIIVTFSEPVSVTENWFEINCTRSGKHAADSSGTGKAYTLAPQTNFARSENCTVSLSASQVTDQDSDDPPDAMESDISFSFSTLPTSTILINELDADTSGSDTAEFIELAGPAGSPLDDLVLVLYNGSTDRSYAAFDLGGFQTSAAGFFVIGSTAVPNVNLIIPDGLLQNGADAAALYRGTATDYPNGTAVTTHNLLDALVYDTADDDDPGLLPLLLTGEPQIDESSRGQPTVDSNQRCPNGTGGQRKSSSYLQNLPTPGASNKCTYDSAPEVVATLPVSGAAVVPLSTTIAISFSEPVTVTTGWFDITCSSSGNHETVVVNDDASFVLDPQIDFVPGESCTTTVYAAMVQDQDEDDPPDIMAADYQWTFTLAAPPIPSQIIINEVDADTAGIDEEEFIELYDGGDGISSLAGLVVVFFNGENDLSYAAIDLDGYFTDDTGYFVLGNTAVANIDLALVNGRLQNGADAVALYAGSAVEFPKGTAVTTNNLLDALVYDTADADDLGLLPLLFDGEPQVDEDGRQNKEGDSNQRCPNGTGEQRRTASYLQNLPTPGASNKCTYDDGPQIRSTLPKNGAKNVIVDSNIWISFSEPVTTTNSWFDISCSKSGQHAAAVHGGDAAYILDPAEDFAAGENCTTTIFKAKINDLDRDDPPDLMAADFQWYFSTQSPRAAEHMIINEVDADTPGDDKGEFIELFAAGTGKTDLSGLVVVLFNGHNDQSYLAIDLDGRQTTEAGYFVIGSDDVTGVDVFIPGESLQNGADAIALYTGSAADFPDGTGITTTNLLDALVYDTADDDDLGLLPLLFDGEPQVDEDGRQNKEGDSNQRCPNGAGEQRRTTSYIQNQPTPGIKNKCTFDDAPQVRKTTPEDGAVDVAVDTSISISFSESVTLSPGWFEINCAIGGRRPATISGNRSAYILSLDETLTQGDSCTVTLLATNVHDDDGDDPPDFMETNYQWAFTTISTPVARYMIINEIDADTPGADQAEFIELYDGGSGETALDGLSIVLYTGANDLSYRSFDLTGFSTNTAGYFLLGNQDIPGVNLVFGQGVLQNGADAAVLYAAPASDFPNGTVLTTSNILDALVYGTADDDDAELLSLLLDGEPQVDEDSRQNKEGDSSQRCPNGTGEQRRTASYIQNLPTPGTSNKCFFDKAPEVNSTAPQDGAANVALDSTLIISFSEPVTLANDWFAINCEISGDHKAPFNRNGTVYTLDPLLDFVSGESCQVTLFADKVSDLDDDDPPDKLPVDFQWHFSTPSPPAATYVMINEVDADTEGVDRLEFVELYDGGSGLTALDGLVLVFYNGTNDLSYHSIDLDGLSSDSAGYFVIGNEAVAGVDLSIKGGSLQNGPDAVALYEGNEEDFPNGTPLTTKDLLDALVYDTADADDNGLLALLHDEQPQLDEAGRGDKESHSNQRCPNGSGGQRISSGYLQNPPTPGAPNDCTVDLPPQITGTWPLSGAVDIPLTATITISFSEAVQTEEPWFTLSCERSGGYAVHVSGGPISYKIVPDENFWPRDICTGTVTAQQIVDLDGLPDPQVEDFSWTFNTGIPSFGTCGDPALPIHLIQGSGPSTPLTQTQAVVVEGIVSGDFQGPEGLGGFFLQQAPQTMDDDPQTSEGIFIEDNDLGSDVSITEILRLQGDIKEVAGLTTIGEMIQLQRCGVAPALIPTTVTLPVKTISEWESVEGMLVEFRQPLAVTGSDNLGHEGSVDLALNGRLAYPTEFIQPGDAVLSATDLNNRSQIRLDDGHRQTNPLPLPPYLGISTTLRVGDTLDQLSGILAENSAGYHIQPTDALSFTRIEQRPPAPPPPGNHLRLAYFDAEAFFNGDGQGGGFPGEGGAPTTEAFIRQRRKIISALIAMEADIITLNGIENDGYGETSALRDLVTGLNEASAGTPFNLVDPGLPKLGETPTAAALIYRRDRALPQGAALTTDTVPFYEQDSQPLLQAFKVAGSSEYFIVAAVQFVGREACPAEGNVDADQGDGQGCYASLRAQTAAALHTWLAADPTGIGDLDTIILGNLNAYRLEDPLGMLHEAGYLNLAGQFLPDAGYTTVRDGRTGSLHYALASPSMAAQVQHFSQWHMNAAEPQALDYHESNQPQLYDPGPYRSSAHDPLIIDLDLIPISARFVTDAPVRIGRPVQFKNLSSGPGTLSYVWDFGDGSPPVSTADAFHLYTAVGSYRVILTVRTPWGATKVYSAVVTVTPMQLFFPVTPAS